MVQISSEKPLRKSGGAGQGRGRQEATKVWRLLYNLLNYCGETFGRLF